MPQLTIKLNNGIMVKIPRRFNYSNCRCGADDIVWATVIKSNKKMPIRWDEIEEAWISHFEDCPFAKKFRKKKKI